MNRVQCDKMALAIKDIDTHVLSRMSSELHSSLWQFAELLGITLANNQNLAHELLTGFMQCPQDRRLKAIEGTAAKSQFEAITTFANANPTGQRLFLPMPQERAFL